MNELNNNFNKFDDQGEPEYSIARLIAVISILSLIFVCADCKGQAINWSPPPAIDGFYTSETVTEIQYEEYFDILIWEAKASEIVIDGETHPHFELLTDSKSFCYIGETQLDYLSSLECPGTNCELYVILAFPEISEVIFFRNCREKGYLISITKCEQ